MRRISILIISSLVTSITIAHAERGVVRSGAVHGHMNVNRAAITRENINRTNINRTTVNRAVVDRHAIVNSGAYVAPAYVVPTATTLPAGCVWVPAYTDSNGDVIPGYQSC